MNELKDKVKSFRGQLGVASEGPLEIKCVDKVSSLLSCEEIIAMKERVQLGLLPKATNWKKATHTRYDHSVGVVAKAIVVSDQINKNTEDALKLHKDKKALISKHKIEENDLLELCVAALLHDCGHLPISHATERAILSVIPKPGATHEERIVPFLLIDDSKYLKSLRDIIIRDWKLTYDSLLRIAILICGDKTFSDNFLTPNFIWPKRALIQILNSALDVDRIDYIIRDSSATDYGPVTAMFDRIINVLNGIILVNAHMIGKDMPRKNDIELCLKSSYLTDAFHLLVARILLYKYVYFNERVRSLEGVLTNIVAELIRRKIYLNFLEMMCWSDNEMYDELEKRIKQIPRDERGELENLLDTLRRDSPIYALASSKINDNKRVTLSIKPENINNPRLREEFEVGLNSRKYIQNLRAQLLDIASQKVADFTVKDGDFLLDAFRIKTGGDKFLVLEENETVLSKALNTLDYYMNGSNMNRLCSETRLDFYWSKGMNDTNKAAIASAINWFCGR